ncbi:tautomerase family protein [Paraglaciecola chathamensis]|uniref:4-oxalocrotonate tautomerase n=1 Tax=Paraglaciecola agarilytica NO2 TaxID=1125747 RepID=A0ABQ0IA45_9ALTE|nr:tautomerase family protein [Paraglaciecola agarilytica]GAC06225.1 4-oxalocrotonate tautomerase [Paraglaciecola agarilytica NO2]
MPIIEMHLLEGRTPEQKTKLAKAVTDAVTESLGVNASTVRILMTEHRSYEFYVAGVAPAHRLTEQNEITSQD